MSSRLLILCCLLLIAVAVRTFAQADGAAALLKRLDEADAISRQRNYAEALEIFRAVGREAPAESAVHARARLREGVMLRELGNIEPATAAIEEARDVYAKLGDAIGVATVWSELGLLHERAGRRDEALHAQHRALAAGGDALPLKERALIETRIGVIHRQRGDLARAIEHYENARRLAIEAKDIGGEARALTNLTVAHLSQGNFREAERYGLRSLVITPKSADQTARARVLSNLGVIAERQNQLQLALKRYREAAALVEKAGATQGIAILKGNLADVELKRGNPGAAAKHLEAALSVAEKGNVPAVKPALLLRLSQARRELGDHKRALEHARAAVALAEQTNNQPELADALLQVAQTLRASGESQQADETAARSAQLANEIKHLDTAWRALTLRGEVADGAAALPFFTEAVEVIEQIRGQTAGGDVGRQRYFSDKLVPYHGIIRLKHRAGAIEEALAWAERSKARVIVDALSSPASQTEAHDLEFSPDLLARVVPEPNVLALHYVVMEEETLLFTARRADGETKLEAYPIAAGAAELNAKVSAFRDRLAARGRGFTTAASELFKLLLGPAVGVAENGAALIIIPDGALLELPFTALLTAPMRYVLDGHVVRYAPSFTALEKMSAKLQARQPTDTLLLVAAPDTSGHEEDWASLPEARRLAESLRKLYDDEAFQLLTADQATPARFTEQAGKHDVIHVAAHAVLDNTAPLFSRLIVAREGSESAGVVTAADLMKMPLAQTRLVVLSACETARGQASSGEGMIGLSWSLMLAGTPGCVVTQWKVESRSVADLMEDFHAELLRGSDAAHALRDAACKLRAEKETEHPFYWAPFVMLGAG